MCDNIPKKRVIMNKSLKQNLKAAAHKLKPVILIGDKGLSQAVLAETASALQAHELIKVKIHNRERDERTLIATQICDNLGAQLINKIGNTIVLYRENEVK
jgi:RNA-binding protein